MELRIPQEDSCFTPNYFFRFVCEKHQALIRLTSAPLQDSTRACVTASVISQGKHEVQQLQLRTAQSSQRHVYKTVSIINHQNMQVPM